MLLIAGCWHIRNEALVTQRLRIKRRCRWYRIARLRYYFNTAIEGEQVLMLGMGVGEVRHSVSYRELSQQERFGRIVCWVWHEPPIVALFSRRRCEMMQAHRDHVIEPSGTGRVKLSAAYESNLPDRCNGCNTSRIHRTQETGLR